jgi:hypothetical protein
MGKLGSVNLILVRFELDGYYQCLMLKINEYKYKYTVANKRQTKNRNK